MTQKAVSLEAQEQTFLESLNQDRDRALAQVGALSLDMETARKNLDAVQERQRAFVRQALMHRGVNEFQSARINGPNLEYVTAEAPGPISIPKQQPDFKETAKGKGNGSVNPEA